MFNIAVLAICLCLLLSLLLLVLVLLLNVCWYIMCSWYQYLYSSVYISWYCIFSILLYILSKYISIIHHFNIQLCTISTTYTHLQYLTSHIKYPNRIILSMCIKSITIITLFDTISICIILIIVNNI